MLKIEQFVKQQYGIVLSKKQTELIALIAANPTDKLGLHNPANTADTTMALKAVMAYLQDGVSTVEAKS